MFDSFYIKKCLMKTLEVLMILLRFEVNNSKSPRTTSGNINNLNFQILGIPLLMKQNFDVFISLAVINFSLQKMDHRLPLKQFLRTAIVITLKRSIFSSHEKKNCDVFISLAVIVFSLQKMDHQLLLNPAQERYTMSSAQKSESEGDVVVCPGMENNGVLLPGGNNHVIELSPVKKEAETTLDSLDRKRSSTEMGEMSTVSKTSGGSSGTESSPAKKKMEAMKKKCPNAGLANQVVDIASLFLHNPR
jgi:hypothetical protein